MHSNYTLRNSFACSDQVFTWRFRSHSSLLIGREGFPAMHLGENVCVAMKVVANCIPRGWSNLQSIHVNSEDSIALPVNNSLPRNSHRYLYPWHSHRYLYPWHSHRYLYPYTHTDISTPTHTTDIPDIPNDGAASSQEGRGD